MDTCDRYEKLVEAAERVAEVVRREERRARDAQDFPFAKDPSQSAQWHERERARRLMRQAASLAEAERRTDETN